MKIYDCFTFFNELDLLEIRLNELNDVVDYFVLVESKKSFQNKQKICYYFENMKKFSKFNHKIIRLEIPESDFTSNPWHNEQISWNYCINGLINANDDDIIMISAIDEIPKFNTVKKIIEEQTVPCCISMKFYCFYINAIYKFGSDNIEWNGTYVTQYSCLDKNNMYSFIETRKQANKISGGWHFSFIGDEKSIFTKVNNYSHSEFNHFTEEFYKERIKNLEDPFGRNGELKYYDEEKIKNLPKFVLKNLKKYSKYLKK